MVACSFAGSARPRPPFRTGLPISGSRDSLLLRRPDGTVLVAKGECAIRLRENAGQVQHIDRAGILVGGEIATLVDGGFQKFFRTPSGKNKPALASELKALHDFQEELREALGIENLYNEALGTVSTYYLYDRVKDRDRGVPKRVWEQ
jgi:hypothetical protein